MTARSVRRGPFSPGGASGRPGPSGSPGPSGPAGPGRGAGRHRRIRVGHGAGAYGLPVLGALLLVALSLALPETFPTMANATAILSSHAITAVLALGATIPIVTGKFDLSIGYGLGLWHILVLQLVVAGDPWPWACLAVLAGGAVLGVINGLLVEFARIDSFIATLGTGSVLYAVSGWVTGGGRVVPGPQGLPEGFTGLYGATFLGLPAPGFYVLLLAAALWVLLERLPLGRCLYVIGSNPRAAELLGIPTRRYVVYAFVCSGLVTGCAGVLLAAQQQIGSPSVGIDYLLPAFAAALLGSTTVKAGRPNAVGTVVAVAVLAIGLSGLGQLGADFWVTPLFNGVMLLIAVGLAGYAARRRLRAGQDGRAAGEDGRGAEQGRHGPSATAPRGSAAAPGPPGAGTADAPADRTDPPQPPVEDQETPDRPGSGKGAARSPGAPPRGGRTGDRP